MEYTRKLYPQKDTGYLFYTSENLAFSGSGLAKALAAIDWSTLTRFKGYFGFFATLGTSRGKHFSPGTTAALALSVLATGKTALGFIGKTL